MNNRLEHIQVMNKKLRSIDLDFKKLSRGQVSSKPASPSNLKNSRDKTAMRRDTCATRYLCHCRA